MDLESLRKKNEQIRKEALNKDLKDSIVFCDISLHPDMNPTLMNDKELVIAHLFTHTNFFYSKPKFGRDILIGFHYGIVNEMKRRSLKHPNVNDLLDKVYIQEAKII